jgi:hypothetical protein
MPKYQAKPKESFVSAARKVHGEKYQYYNTNYVKAKEKVTIECPTHGAFRMEAYRHLHGRGCPTCNQALSTEHYAQRFLRLATEIHGTTYDYSRVPSQYRTSQIKAEIGCPTHGVFLQTPANHLQGMGCFKCRRTTYRKDTDEEFIEKAKTVHGDKYSYSKVDYRGSGVKVLIECPTHGEFQQLPYLHLGGSGCRACFMVRCKVGYSAIAIEWLNHEAKRRNIFIQHALNGGEKRFYGPSGETYYVDGYCEATKQIFEFHGSFWHAHPAYCKNRSAKHGCYRSYTNKEVYQRTLKREAHLRLYNEVIVCWEHDFLRIKNSVSAPIAVEPVAEGGLQL